MQEIFRDIKRIGISSELQDSFERMRSNVEQEKDQYRKIVKWFESNAQELADFKPDDIMARSSMLVGARNSEEVHTHTAQ